MIDDFDTGVDRSHRSQRKVRLGSILGGLRPLRYIKVATMSPNTCGAEVIDQYTYYPQSTNTRPMQSGYREYPYQVDDGREDLGSTNVFRVVRGGSWMSSQSNARCSLRDRLSPDNSSSTVGFRLVSPSN